ncbi:MAG: hypothetical protein HYS53_01275 [Candidatus Aenigmarchaeota archaeon]|nr:hypothetical protein [Candidatus Aenigmarchaeota archaeon]
MREPFSGKMHIYSAHFEPKPLAGVRFANPDIIRTFRKEMEARWEKLGAYLISCQAMTSLYMHNLTAEQGLEAWTHTEGGTAIMQTQSGVFLPPRPYMLAGLCDAFIVDTATGRGVEYEVEILLRSGHEKIIEDAREIMQAGLPPSVVAREETKRLYTKDVDGGLMTRIELHPDVAKKFREN